MMFQTAITQKAALGHAPGAIPAGYSPSAAHRSSVRIPSSTSPQGVLSTKRLVRLCEPARSVTASDEDI